MRHGKKFNHLSRNSSHRRALLTNLAKSIILKKRIFTTLAKAKALRKFVEKIITKSKIDSTHSRRIVFSYFQDKEPVKELFNNIASKVNDRPGGYTRIIKLSDKRVGDNAEMCFIELVDFNEFTASKTKSQSKAKTTRRSRSKSKTNKIDKTENQETKLDSKNISKAPKDNLEDLPKISNQENNSLDASSKVHENNKEEKTSETNSKVESSIENDQKQLKNNETEKTNNEKTQDNKETETNDKK